MDQKLVRPIILLCSERSGSNLIAKMFDAHRDICGPGAAHLFKVMSEVSLSYAAASSQLRNAVLDLFFAKMSAWRIDALGRRALSEHLASYESAGEMCAALYAAEAAQSGKQYVFLKENSAFAFLPLLLGQSNKARLLFMVRDPRDMAVSWINGPVMRGGTIRASARWVYDQRGGLAALSNRPADMLAATLRYEDLLLDPQTELARVCRALEIDFSDEMLQFSDRSASAQTDAQRSSMWANLSKPLIKDNTQKFRTELDADQIAYIEAVCGPYMDVFGYKRVTDPTRPFGEYGDLPSLSAALEVIEPYDKAAYQKLPAGEREGFEAWSRLYQAMKARPPVPPENRVLPV